MLFTILLVWFHSLIQCGRGRWTLEGTPVSLWQVIVRIRIGMSIEIDRITIGMGVCTSFFEPVGSPEVM